MIVYISQLLPNYSSCSSSILLYYCTNYLIVSELQYLRRRGRWHWEGRSLCRPSPAAAAAPQMWKRDLSAVQNRRCGSECGSGSTRRKRSWCPDQECSECKSSGSGQDKREVRLGKLRIAYWCVDHVFKSGTSQESSSFVKSRNCFNNFLCRLQRKIKLNVIFFTHMCFQISVSCQTSRWIKSAKDQQVSFHQPDVFI